MIAPIPNTTVSTPQTKTTENVSVTEQNVGQDNIKQIIREAILRALVDGSIKKNESSAFAITTGVQITDLQNGHTILSHNQDTEQFAASVNKVPVALLVLQDLQSGKLTMDQTLSWLPSDQRGGNGVYDKTGAPTSAKLSEVLFDMLNPSGNTAVRVLVNKALGGAAAVNTRWATYPELSHTRLQPLDAERFYLGNSTPHDSLWALQKLMEPGGPYVDFMKHALATNIYTDYGARSQLAGNNWILLANKVGILDDPTGDNRHDVGIIYNFKTHKSYAYSFMNTAPEDKAGATGQAEQSLKDMGRYTLRYAGDTPTASGASPRLPFSMQQGLKPERKVLY